MSLSDYEVVELTGEPLQAVDLGGLQVDPATPVVAGPQGPPGERGPQGPPGGAAVAYVHVQTVPAATWTIRHQLGGCPLPTLIPDDSNGRPVWADLAYPDDDTLVVEWPEATTGRAYL